MYPHSLLHRSHSQIRRRGWHYRCRCGNRHCNGSRRSTFPVICTARYRVSSTRWCHAHRCHFVDEQLTLSDGCICVGRCIRRRRSNRRKSSHAATGPARNRSVARSPLYIRSATGLVIRPPENDAVRRSRQLHSFALRRCRAQQCWQQQERHS
jgi:hypothetical protein